MQAVAVTCLPNQPGRLKAVQALGWYLEEANLAQVSVNINDFEITPIHVVYEEVCKDAEVSNANILQICLFQLSHNSPPPQKKHANYKV